MTITVGTGTGTPEDAFSATPAEAWLIAGTPSIVTLAIGTTKFPVVEGPGQVKTSEISVIVPVWVCTRVLAVTLDIAGTPVPSWSPAASVWTFAMTLSLPSHDLEGAAERIEPASVQLHRTALGGEFNR